MCYVSENRTGTSTACSKVVNRSVNLHVFSEGCAEIKRMLLFRDWIRHNKADCALYERTKRELAEREWKYVQNYADAKGAVVEEIVERARAYRHNSP